MAEIKNRGWTVTMAGLGINLALGILYTWSIFKQAIKESIVAGDGRFNWDLASLNDPYAVCCLMFTGGNGGRRPPSGQTQPPDHGHLRRPVDRCRTSGKLPVDPAGQLDHRVRCSHRSGARVRICLGHPAGHQVVSVFENRHDRRARGGRFRPGSRLYRASGQFSDRQLRHRHLHADFRIGLSDRGLRPGHVPGQSPRGLCRPGKEGRQKSESHSRGSRPKTFLPA